MTQKTLTQVLTDVTLREGSQQELDFKSASVEEKLSLAKAIRATGISKIELTAFAPGEWFSDASLLVTGAEKAGLGNFVKAIYFNTKGLEDSLSYPFLPKEGVIHTAATEKYRAKNYRQGSLKETAEKVKRLLESFSLHKISLDTVVISTCWGEPEERIDVDQAMKFISWLMAETKLLGFSPSSLTLCDTTGVASPAQIKDLFKNCAVAFPKQKLRAHLHPPSNIAEDSIDAAIEGGATEWEAAWGGVGGSPLADKPGGNLDIRWLMRVWKRRGWEHGLDSKAVGRVLLALKGLTKRPITEIEF